ncbi:Hypothetical protein A7982_08730 [Minicystis rosea]|nr:Hypothetical protein A7982_08730 [Minicystis rosea]
MSLLGLLVLLVVGAICGGIAEAIVGYSPGGLLASIAVGFVGALLGGWLARVLGLPSVLALRIESVTIEVVWSILGAIVLLGLVSLIRRRRYV